MDLEVLSMDNPELKEIQQLFDKKLYHDVFLQIDSFVTSGAAKSAQVLQYLGDMLIPETIDIYNQSAVGFNIDTMELAVLCVKIALSKKAFAAGTAIVYLNRGLNFLQTLLTERIGERTDAEEIKQDFIEAQLVIKTRLATLKFESKMEDEAKLVLKEGEEYILYRKSHHQSVDSELYRQHYFLAMNFYRNDDAAKYLEAALQYLSYKPLEELDAKIQMGIARDIIHAAIFSSETFNFGKILFHPLMKCLEGTEHEDLLNLVRAFEQGSMDKFEKYKGCLGVSGDREKKLEEKMRLMALMVTCWKLDTNPRGISFRTIANTCKIKQERVEYALMRAMSVGLLEGQINEVRGWFTITKVRPRDIDTGGVDNLLGKVDAWLDKIDRVSELLQANAS